MEETPGDGQGTAQDVLRIGPGQSSLHNDTYRGYEKWALNRLYPTLDLGVAGHRETLTQGLGGRGQNSSGVSPRVGTRSSSRARGRPSGAAIVGSGMTAIHASRWPLGAIPNPTIDRQWLFRARGSWGGYGGGLWMHYGIERDAKCVGLVLPCGRRKQAEEGHNEYAASEQVDETQGT